MTAMESSIESTANNNQEKLRQPIGINEATDILESNFDKIDKNADSYLVPEELESLPDNLSTRDRLVIEAFGGASDEIRGLSAPWILMNKGISREDLKILKSDPAKSQDARLTLEAKLPGRDIRKKHTFGDVLNQHFDVIDKNSSNNLSKSELKDFSTNTDYPEDAREVASVVYNHFDEFRNLSNLENFDGNERGLKGPFYSSNRKTVDNISREDVDAFNILARPEKFKTNLKYIRAGEIASGTVGSAALGVTTLLMGSATIAFAEIPPMAVVAGAGTVASGAGTVAFLDLAIRGTTNTIRKEYQDRQNMLDSWKYFK